MDLSYRKTFFQPLSGCHFVANWLEMRRKSCIWPGVIISLYF